MHGISSSEKNTLNKAKLEQKRGAARGWHCKEVQKCSTARAVAALISQFNTHHVHGVLYALHSIDRVYAELGSSHHPEVAQIL